MSDLIDRLRDIAHASRLEWPADEVNAMNEAADELERLLAEQSAMIENVRFARERAERAEAELADERKRHDENLVLGKQAEAERDALRKDAEQAAGKTAMRCIEMAMWPQSIDDEQAYYGKMFAEFIEKEFKSAIDAAMREGRGEMSELVERLRRYNPPDRTVDEERQIAQDIHDAADEIERLRADAERYRWLRKESVHGWNLLGHYTQDALDAAIDAAMRGKEQSNG